MREGSIRANSTWLTVVPTQPCSTICSIFESAGSWFVAKASSWVFFCMSSMATSMGTRMIWKTKDNRMTESYTVCCVFVHVLHWYGNYPHLLLVDNIDTCLDVRKSMRCRQDGFAFVLLVQVTVGSAVKREGSTVHEGTQVVVLVKVGDSFL